MNKREGFVFEIQWADLAAPGYALTATDYFRDKYLQLNDRHGQLSKMVSTTWLMR